MFLYRARSPSAAAIRDSDSIRGESDTARFPGRDRTMYCAGVDLVPHHAH
jgi:hypothetical protein